MIVEVVVGGWSDGVGAGVAVENIGTQHGALCSKVVLAVINCVAGWYENEK